VSKTVENIVRVALAGQRILRCGLLLVNERHNAGKRRRGDGCAAYTLKGVLEIGKVAGIREGGGVALAHDVEAAVEAVAGEERNIGEIAMIVAGHAFARLPGRFRVNGAGAAAAGDNVEQAAGGTAIQAVLRAGIIPGNFRYVRLSLSVTRVLSAVLFSAAITDFNTLDLL
jgi:hypothetical protein